MMINKDIPINETFELKVKCVEVNIRDCSYCVGFYLPGCNSYLGECREENRSDKRNVIYVIDEN